MKSSYCVLIGWSLNTACVGLGFFHDIVSLPFCKMKQKELFTSIVITVWMKPF